MSRSERGNYNFVAGVLLIAVLSLLGGLSATSTDWAIVAKDKLSEGIQAHGLLLRSVFPSNEKKGTYNHVWPDLELNWRVALGTAIGFLGGALGSVGGIGGGGIFVPMLTLIVGFDQKSSTALSKCMIMGASAASVWFNFRLKTHTENSAIIDYDLALIFQPMLMLGISIGVVFNVIFPNWLVTILLIILFIGTSTKTFLNAVSLWKKETIQKNLNEEEKSKFIPSEEGLENGDYESLQPAEDVKSNQICFNINWKGISALLFVWISFLILQILKNYTATCSSLYWVLNVLQVPVAFFVFLTEAVSLYNRTKHIGQEEQQCFISAAQVHWTIPRLVLCAVAALVAGIVGGLLGLGGGFILGPLLLELGVPPQISSATATFVMLFSSSMSVIEYYLLHRFPVPFALYLFTVNLLAGFWGQYVVRRLVILLGRASVIIFILAIVIFFSAISLGGYGIEDTIVKLENKEYMGFLSLCST